MVDGKAAFLSHVGQILEWSPYMRVPRPASRLVVSEAVWPKHQYTPVEDYLQEQAEGKCRLTLMDIDPIVWAGDLEAKKFAESECYNYHIGLKGTKYGLNIFPALLAFSIYRNFTPFCRGRFENIIIKKFTKIFICSNEIDSGWEIGQIITKIDWFLSSLHKFITTPEDIFEGPFTRFIGGWKRKLLNAGEVVGYAADNIRMDTVASGEYFNGKLYLYKGR